MGSLEAVLQRIAQYRVCLERDTECGIIPVPAQPCVDSCFATLCRVLETARIEFEGAGVAVASDDFAGHFVGSCGDLARRMFRNMYRERDPQRLARRAENFAAEARDLMEHLWLRLQRAA